MTTTILPPPVSNDSERPTTPCPPPLPLLAECHDTERSPTREDEDDLFTGEFAPALSDLWILTQCHNRRKNIEAN